MQPARAKKMPEVQQRRGFLHVMVHAANGLPAADFKLIKKPSSDPFCILEFAGQHRMTRTIKEDLNPTWEEMFSFQVGPYLPLTALSFLGGQKPVSRLENLKFRVFDEDQITAHDLLGECFARPEILLKTPRKWHKEQLLLEPPPGISKRGTLIIFLCWEPAPVLPAYLLNILAVICFASAAGLLLVSAGCRWQPGSLEMGAVKQPGVGVAAVVAATVMLLSAVLHFIVAHLGCGANLDTLAAKHAMEARPFGTGSSSAEVSTDDVCATQSVVSIRLKPTRLTEYELTVTPTVDFALLYLPLVVLDWLLPLAGTALVLLAFAMQLQGLNLSFCAGEVCGAAALCTGLTGAYCMVQATKVPYLDTDKLRQHLKSTKAKLPPEQDDASETALIREDSVSQVPRRRDLLLQKISGICGLHS